MSRTPDTISTLRRVLAECRTLAVVGLSPQWHRPSFFAAKYMQAHGWRIVPVNPLVAKEGGSILGEKAHASVREADAAVRAQGGRIDMVIVSAGARTSRRWPRMPSPSAKRLRLQLGVVNEPLRARPRTPACW